VAGFVSAHLMDRVMNCIEVELLVPGRQILLSLAGSILRLDPGFQISFRVGNLVKLIFPMVYDKTTSQSTHILFRGFSRLLR